MAEPTTRRQDLRRLPAALSGAPTPIGTALVRLVRVDGPVLVVRGLDCLDGTPLLDIKPDRCAYSPKTPPKNITGNDRDGGRDMRGLRKAIIAGAMTFVAGGVAAEPVELYAADSLTAP